MALKVGELFALLKLDKGPFDRGIGDAGGAFGKFASIGVSALAAVGTAIGAAGVAAVGFGVKYNASMEQARISFTTLLGSANDASKMIQDLQKFAADTPFEFPGIQDSAKLMLAMGFNAKQVIPNLTAIGDAVSAVGGGEDVLNGVTMALGQMLTKGKISAEEMNQLAERGIPAWDLLAQSTGKSKKELMDLSSQGKLLSDQVLPGMIDAMGNKFKGAMENQSKTMNGMISTIKDNVGMIVGSMTEGIFNQIKTILPGVLEFLNKLQGALKKGGIKEAFEQMVPKEVRDNIIKIFNSIVTKGKPIFEDLKAIFFQFVEIIQGLWSIFGGNIIAIISSAWNIITSVIGGAVKIIKGILDFFIGLFTGDWSRMGKGLVSIWDGIWQAIGGILKGVWNILVNVFGDLLARLVKWFLDLNKRFNDFGKDIVMGLVNGIKNTLHKVYDTMDDLSNNIKKKFKNALGISSPSKVMAEYGINITEGLAKGINTGQNFVQKAVGEMSNFDIKRKNTFNSLEDGMRNNPSDVKIYLNEGAIKIAAESLREVEDVIDLFKNIRQIARQGA